MSRFRECYTKNKATGIPFIEIYPISRNPRKKETKINE